MIEIENKNVQNNLDYHDYRYFKSEAMPSVQSMFKNNDPTIVSFKSQALKSIESYLDGIKKPEDVFDLKILAKYVAVKDLFMSQEISWDEIKWYFNPLTGQLEPIDFDVHAGIKNIADPINCCHISPSPFFQEIFKSEIFQKYYFQSLREITEPELLAQFFLDNKNFLEREEKILRHSIERRNTEYLETIKSSLIERAAVIRKLLYAKNTIAGYYEMSDEEIKITVSNLNSTVPLMIKQLAFAPDNIIIEVNEIIRPLSKQKLSINAEKFATLDVEKFARLSPKKKLLSVNYSVIGGSEKYLNKAFFPN